MIEARYFFFLLALAGIGVVCCGLRAYGRDAFRQHAFALRDELFDYAAVGNISFNDPAYWRLRLTMNSTIRYSHRLTFGEALLPLLIKVLVSPNGAQASTPWYQAWQHAVSEQKPDVKSTLQQYDQRFRELLVSHLLVYSPLAWPLVLVAFLRANWSDIQASILAKVDEIEADALDDADPEWLQQQGIRLAA